MENGLCGPNRIFGRGLEQVWALGCDGTDPSGRHLEWALCFPLYARAVLSFLPREQDTVARMKTEVGIGLRLSPSTEGLSSQQVARKRNLAYV